MTFGGSARVPKGLYVGYDDEARWKDKGRLCATPKVSEPELLLEVVVS